MANSDSVVQHLEFWTAVPRLTFLALQTSAFFLLITLSTGVTSIDGKSFFGCKLAVGFKKRVVRLLLTPELGNSVRVFIFWGVLRFRKELPRA